MKLTKVTFTGIDDRTDVKHLQQLQRRYPFVEFGVLLSYDWNVNGNRFINPVYLSIFRDRGLNFSAHFCGQSAYDIAIGKREEMEKLLGNNIGMFQRCQLNLDAGKLRYLSPIPYIDEIIVQMYTAEMCREFLECTRPKSVSYLIDASCGAGIDTPNEIVTSPGINIGYAGGIGPDNVEKKLRKLLDYPSDEKFWIDMETRVRTDDWFDLDKVEQVLKICDAMIKEQSPSK